MTLSLRPAFLPSSAAMAGGRLRGRLVELVLLDAREHGAALWQALAGQDELWRYMPDSPPVDEDAFHAFLEQKAGRPDPFFFAILDRATHSPIGIVAYMRIEPLHRAIEVGNVLFSPLLQRTAQATEAMFLMARHVFDDLGYRRYEWKCNALNDPSRRAALRLGFVFEGIFRQHMIVKDENRDTAWFSMLDSEWPALAAAFEQWLEPTNFNADGSQKRTLLSFRDK